MHARSYETPRPPDSHSQRRSPGISLNTVPHFVYDMLLLIHHISRGPGRHVSTGEKDDCG
jgi:hypothetical protein